MLCNFDDAEYLVCLSTLPQCFLKSSLNFGPIYFSFEKFMLDIWNCWNSNLKECLVFSKQANFDASKIFVGLR